MYDEFELYFYRRADGSVCWPEELAELDESVQDFAERVSLLNATDDELEELGVEAVGSELYADSFGDTK